ncbi:MAG: hypothetical protein V9E96_05585 [Chitinophagaceae bacterium]
MLKGSIIPALFLFQTVTNKPVLVGVILAVLNKIFFWLSLNVCAKYSSLSNSIFTSVSSKITKLKN